MRTRFRTLALAVTAAFGVTAIAPAGGPFAERLDVIGLIASAYAKDEGGASGGGHTSGSTSGGHTSGASSGGHTTGGSTSHASGGSSGGHTTGGSTSHASGGSSGGHTTGGSTSHASGGGHTPGGKGGGHSSGADGGHASGGGKGAPHVTSSRHGMEQAGHGTKPGHEGHASGVHGANAKHGGNTSTYYTTGAARTFGGGSGIAGLDGVMEGPARFAPNSSLSLTEALQPGPKFTFRYWGGWAVPDDGGGGDGGGGTKPPTVVVEETSTPIGGGGGPLAGTSLPSAARCDGVGSNMPTKSFYTNSNLTRLDAARMELDPEAIGNKRGLDPTLMAAVQEALVDGRPDAVAVGAYLGMMSRSAVTPEAVKRVAWRLCAPMTDELAKSIAQSAEEVRVTAKAE